MACRLLRRGGLALLAACLCVPPLAAQEAPALGIEPALVRGEIRAQGTKDPIADAEIVINGISRGRSDARGRFQVDLAGGSHLLQVRRIGYAPAVARLELDAGSKVDIVIELPVQAIQLDTIVIVGRNLPYWNKLREFYDRRDNWRFGQFIGPEVLENITLPRMSDLFYRVKGVDVKCMDRYCTTYGLEAVGRGGSVATGRIECPMEYFVDGIRWNPGPMGVDVLHPESIAAVEVYVSPNHVPAQFSGLRARCGVAVFWLKSGER